MTLLKGSFIKGSVVANLFIATNLVYCVMIFWSLPTLVEFSGGLLVFDMRPKGYSYNDTILLLGSLGEQGMAFYKNTQLNLDMIYPFGFMLTYSSGSIWVFSKISDNSFCGKMGALFAVVAGVADYVENYFIRKMLISFPILSREVVDNSNLATLVKSISTTFALLVFLLGFLILGAKKIRLSRKKRIKK